MEGCKELVQDEWGRERRQGRLQAVIQYLLAGCRGVLSQWSRNVVRERKLFIKEKSEQLKTTKI